MIFLTLTALNLSVAIEAEIREGLLAVDGVVGAGLAGDGLEQPVQALETANSLKLRSFLRGFVLLLPNKKWIKFNK